MSKGPLKYLGLLGGNPNSVYVWMLILDEVSTRLDGWKKPFFLKGRKLDFDSVSVEFYFNLLHVHILDALLSCKDLLRKFLWDGLKHVERTTLSLGIC